MNTPDRDLALDLAAKLAMGQIRSADRRFAESLVNGYERYGSFTDRQRPHVQRLVSAEATPAPVAAETPNAPQSAPAAAWVQGIRQSIVRRAYPRLSALFVPGRLARLTVNPIRISRKHEEAIAFVRYGTQTVGVLENGEFRSTSGMRYASPEEVFAVLDRIEADPVAAAAQHGQETGRCSVCSRELTNATSIARAMGPVCYRRLTGM